MATEKRLRIIPAACLLLAVFLLAGCDGNTELMKSALRDQSDAARSMLDQGVPVDERNNYGWTALMHAARLGNVEVMAVLLDHGADVSASDDIGWTPLMRAAHKGHPEAVKLLLERGADPN